MFSNSKYYYCNNCGKIGHVYKKCTDPITSYGIISFKIDFENLNKELNTNLTSNNFKNLLSTNIFKYNNSYIGDFEIYPIIKKFVKFLVISRKSSLGFIEIMRGHYDVNNLDSLINLFEQMYPEEIILIQNNNFDYLWKYVWNITEIEYDKEFNYCENKFNIIKSKKFIEKCFKNVKSKYSNHEWGFPKGRRSGKESNLDCAKREFNEETNLNTNQYFLLNNIQHVTENLIGTNNIKYKHVYYFAICDNNLEVKIDVNNKLQYKEVGNIEWKDYNEVNNLIRNYHLEKKIILNNLIIFICNVIKNCK